MSDAGEISARVILAVVILVAGAWVLQEPLSEVAEQAEARRIDGRDLTALDDAESVIDWMRSHPDRVSLLVASVGPDGAPFPAVPSVRHNVDEPRPVGTLAYLPALLVWAENALPQSAGVPVSTWERWWLPGVPEAFGHVDAMARLGFAPDSVSSRVSEQDIANAMARHADPTAADWLLDHVGVEAFEAKVAALGMSRTPSPSSMLSRGLITSPDDTAADLDARARQYLAEPFFREQVRDDLSLPGAERSWETSLALLDLWPTSTAHDLSLVLRQVASATPRRGPLGRVAEVLGWPQASPGNADYLAMGGMSFVAPGVAAEVAYAREGGEPGRIVVLVLDDLAYRPWNSLAERYPHQQVVRRLLDEPDLAASLAASWGEGPNTTNVGDP